MVMEWVPTESPAVENVATLLTTVPLPSVVTPSLNRDGTVVYRCALVKKDTVSGEEKIVSTPAVTTIPWLPFKLVVGDMSFGFEPDKIEP